MYSLVMMAAMTASPDVPQALLCPVNQSRYGGGFWLKHCFYDCCAPARYGWVNCWSKGHSSYPTGGCGPCGYGHSGALFHPGACACAPCGGAWSVGAACLSKKCNPCWGHLEWGIGNHPAYYTSVTGCPPHVTAPPYANYTQCNPCCTGGQFAFDTGLIGHSAGVGYAGFSGYGNFGFYGAVPMMHPPTTGDLPAFPKQWDYRMPTAPGSGANVPMPPAPAAGTAPMPPVSPIPMGAVPMNPAPMNVVPMNPAPMNVIPAPIAPPADPKVPVPPDSLLPKPPAATPIPVPEAPKKIGGLRLEPATVVISVPEGAAVSVEGQLLRSTSRERSFRTPGLAAGTEFVYTVKAVLNVGGEEVVETKEVTVIAGQISRTSFEKLFAKVENTSKSIAGK